MRIAELGLRPRFMGAMMLVVLVLSGGFLYAVDRFTQLLEAELLQRTVASELGKFAEAHAAGISAPPRGEGLSAYVAPETALDSLPPRLRRLKPGLHDDIKLEGREYFVGRQDVGGQRLYVLLDVERVEQLEAHLIGVAAAGFLVASLVALLVGGALSRRVLRPVATLSRQVATLVPGQRGAKLGTGVGDREVGAIAEAFDRFLERLDDFVERERAFLADASHELRTPLAVIVSAALLLTEDSGLSPAARERAERIGRAAARMQQLIEALLSLARENDSVEAKPCAMDEIVQEAAQAHGGAIEKRGLTLALDLAAPQTVRAPPGMVVSIVNNLFGNAVHHAGRGAIQVSLHPGRLVVQNAGPGIAPEELPRIFERGQRGPDSRGLGLGLYLVKRMCDHLGWDIRVHSTPGAWTRFELSFPAEPVLTQSERDPNGAPMRA
jgi:signal transduction histidine kinase